MLGTRFRTTSVTSPPPSTMQLVSAPFCLSAPMIPRRVARGWCHDNS